MLYCIRLWKQLYKKSCLIIFKLLYYLQHLILLLGFRFLDSLSRVLHSYLPKISSYDLLKAVYHLCLMGHFPSAPLEKLLQNSTLELFSTTGQIPTHACIVISCLPLVFFSPPHPSELPLFLSSTHVSPEPGANVSDFAPVPPPWSSHPPCATDRPCICPRRTCLQNSIIQCAVALTGPTECAGGPGKHSAAGNDGGGGLLLHR